MSDKGPQPQCRSCDHFRNDPKYLETVFEGLTSLSSGYGSVRSHCVVAMFASTKAQMPIHTSRPTTLIKV